MRYSVALVWLATALVSLLNADGIAQQLLAQGGVYATHWQWTMIAAGAGWDWLVGVWLQIRMARMAASTQAAGASELPALYRQYARTWEWPGYPAFAAMLAIYWLMVHKPPLWG